MHHQQAHCLWKSTIDGETNAKNDKSSVCMLTAVTTATPCYTVQSMFMKLQLSKVFMTILITQ